MNSETREKGIKETGLNGHKGIEMTDYRIEHYTGTSNDNQVKFLAAVKAETAESALEQYMEDKGLWVIEARNANYATALDVTTPEDSYNALVAEPV